MALHTPHLSQDALLNLLVQSGSLSPLSLLPRLWVNHDLVLVIIAVVFIIGFVIRHPILSGSRLRGVPLGSRCFGLLVLAER